LIGPRPSRANSANCKRSRVLSAGRWSPCSEGVSGAKGRDQRPGFDALLKGVARKEFDLIAAWSVCRLGRSLQDLIAFLANVQARGVDLYLHQQVLDTSTPFGRMLFQMLSVFVEFERFMMWHPLRSPFR
jgi:DNA invertase Pin-like site-specific DNA recombinase